MIDYSRRNPFGDLSTTALDQSLSWLRNLPQRYSTVVEFGCTSSEPFALLLLLQATRVAVVELELCNLTESTSVPPVEEFELMRREHPLLFNHSSILFIAGDMLSSPLPPDFCDLAFCKNVLYYFHDDASLARAASEMARVVHPGGLVVAVEPKVGVTHNLVDSDFGRFEAPTGHPRDISSFFDAIGLQRIEIPDAPPYSYCFRKPIDTSAG